ncbi:cyclic nucleotide-binding domain-containing protein [Roseomonas sp. CAU 1739]|uniref:cyclic nucleotide-binding domain-containing protein n=1 Tax=Roseomonas sp. CAU 1739 TaxID=3140364 RepID=UPI00325B3A02
MDKTLIDLDQQKTATRTVQTFPERDSRMANREATHAMVERSPFFQAAGATAMRGLLQSSFTQLLPKRTVLFGQGEEPDFLHLLLEGSVGLEMAGDRGGTTIVEIFRAGEVFVVPAVMLRLPYLPSAVALTEIRVLMIPAQHFRECCQCSLDLSRATNELLCRHWRLMVDQVVDLKLNSVETRVSRFLARRVSEEAGAGCAYLPEPRSAIAARLGMTPETLSRTIAGLEDKGKLRRGAKGPNVSDRGALVDL